MKKVVHQFHACVASRDATGGNVFAIQKALRQHGYESEIFYQVCTEDVKDQIIHLNQYKQYSSQDHILIIHYSIGFPGLDDLLAFPDKKILVYHNITPAEFFDDFNPTVAQYCREGRQLLPKFKNKVDMVIGDSNYNLQELHDLGFKNGIPIPMFFDFEKFKSPPDPEILSKYEKDGKVNWLFVGRVVPNKKFDDVIKTFYYYKKYINPASRLFLVGSNAEMQVYSDYLQYLISSLGLQDVIITGSVPDNALLAYYQIADLFVCLSEHEGFSVPMIEALYCWVPVLAYNAAALPETLGDAGVLILEKKFPEIAELAHYILENPELRDKIIAGQKKRLHDYSAEVVLQKWLNVLNKFFIST